MKFKEAREYTTKRFIPSIFHILAHKIFRVWFERDVRRKRVSG